jgi:hypothetical protein
MANPTGSTNLTENPAYVYTDGDVYQIPQTDTVEGAATGASFSGLGVDNQPHQVLLNKTKVLRNNQLADELNITNLLNFKALFSGTLGANEASSIFKIPFLDSQHGLIQLIIQTGQYIFNQNANDQEVFVSWPVAFPNAFGNIFATPLRDPGSQTANDGIDWGIFYRAQTGSVNGATFRLDSFQAAHAIVMYGFNWLAYGY